MRCFVIAEIGINHNGSIEIAKQLIDTATIAGADAVKLQKRTIEAVYTQEFLNSARVSPWGTTQREQKNGLEFSFEQHRELKSYSEAKGIHYIVSAWDIESQDFVNSLKPSFQKVASPVLASQTILEHIAKSQIYTYVSTGMSDTILIDKAVEIFRGNNCPFELMHCVSTYPLIAEHANLNRIKSLKNRYGCNVGYSGHEVGLAVSLAAIAMGATSLERHITLDRSMYGSDQSASIEPSGLIKLVRDVRTIEKALGNGSMSPHPLELESAIKLRGHL